MNRKKILVVEDNEDNRRILVYRLRKIGDFEIFEAQNGLEAIEMTEKNSPDLIFMDLKMPVMDGWEATKRIRLTSAVNVLSSDDPVRVFQQFATLDLLSGGRAEIMAGRGSFIESFPLFGYELRDYDTLFEEKLRLLLELRKDEVVSWPAGRHRAGIDNRGVYPRPMQDPLPIWVAVGGTPESAVRAGTLGLPMALAIIGGEPARFAPFAQIFRRAAKAAGHDPAPAFSINSHGFIADDSDEAAEIAYGPMKLMMDRIGRERGWPPMTREQFEASRGMDGATFVGSPDEVIAKILFQHEIFAHDRFLIQFTIGTIPHDKVLRSIELFGTVVAPAIREALAARA